MANSIPHDPQAQDVKGDDYDPAYDADKSGDHNKTENEARAAKAKEVKDNVGGMFAQEPPSRRDRRTLRLGFGLDGDRGRPRVDRLVLHGRGNRRHVAHCSLVLGLR